ncbi:uncharacterized protein LOC142625280 [Castanea sativa]|uniref:uncharacterized protein LOC142625280 n=1 Tax=Castanea sativa TaxID=21020 RepID=UPI003F64CCEA
MMCNGEFLNKDPDEAFDYFDLLAKNAQSWDTTDTPDRSRASMNPFGGGKYQLRKDDDLNARVASLTNKLEAMELRKVNGINTVPKIDEVCRVCETVEHITNECPTIPTFKEVLHDQANAMNIVKKSYPSSYSETYNSGWRNHPNFSWRNDNVVAPPTHDSSNFVPYNPPPKKSLEDNLQQFMQTQSTINNHTSQAINDTRRTLTKLTTSMSTIEKAKFPSQPQPNPQGQFCVNDCSSYENKVSQAKSITTLCSGKIIEKDIPKSNIQDESSKIKSSDEVLEPKYNEIARCPIPTPFPQRLIPPQKINQNFEILEALKQVKANIPFLDAIKQIPSYAKILKDLWIVKHKIKVHKKAFLTEQVIAIIQNNRPPKYKDLGCPTISCVLGNSRIEKALLDLGASVNLLPYSVYEQLGLGELKPTSIILQLVNRSVIVPKGVVEDVLVQVDKFYFPVDFIILDMHPVFNANSQISVILRCPFLATSNALINCRSRVLKLSFGNMTLELNIFNTCKQTREEEDVYEVNLIETIVQDQALETCLVNSCDFSFDENSEIAYIHCLLESAQELESSNWKLKYEELSSYEIKLLSSSEKVPKWKLKLWPNDLNYAFLRTNETFSMVISSELDSLQERKLLNVFE